MFRRRQDKDYLSDIHEAMQRIITYTNKLSYEEFISDTKTQDAVIRNLEIIGEATKNLSERLRNAYSSIPWKEMAGLRDRLIHHYFGINYDIVWTIITQEIPKLLSEIENILSRETNYDL